MARYEKPEKRLDPTEFGYAKNIPDNLNVADFQILVVTESEAERKTYENLVESLRNHVKRDWFVQHAYHCLPLTIANQIGYIVKALYRFEVQWNGGPEPSDVTVKPLLNAEEAKHHAASRQIVSPHFGMGTVTIQNRWHYRTAAGINLMTIAPPNHFIDGISHMSGVIETDNLRRDFTFNLKITRPNTPIVIERGTPIGCIIPYPRNFIDQFEMKLASDVAPAEHIEGERIAAHLAGKERSEIDNQYSGGIGRRYMEGKDIFDNKFVDHQNNLHSPTEAARRNTVLRKHRTGSHAHNDNDTTDNPAPGNSDLLHLKAILPAAICGSLCEAWEQLQSLLSNESSRVSISNNSALRFADIQQHQPVAAAYMQLATDLVREHIKSHFGCGPIWADDLQLVKREHTYERDIDKEIPDGSLHMTPWRDFSSVVYLNSDCEGGAIECPDLALTLHPQLGDVICFRGDLAYTHKVQRFASGQRYTMPVWFTAEASRRNQALYPDS